MGSKPKAPPPRSYQNEMFEALRAQAAVMPEMMALEKRYVPEMQKLQQLGLRGQMDFINEEMKRRIPQFGARAREYVASLAPAMEAGGDVSRKAMLAGMGKDAQSLLNTMSAQAREELGAGRGLTTGQRMFAEDSARRAGAARGLTLGNQGLAYEILASEQMADQRENRARQYANTVIDTNRNIAATGGQLYGGTINAGIAGVNPLNLLGVSEGFQKSIGPDYFTPESGYQAQLIGGNQNMAFQASAGAAAASNQMTGTVIGAAGALI